MVTMEKSNYHCQIKRTLFVIMPYEISYPEVNCFLEQIITLCLYKLNSKNHSWLIKVEIILVGNYYTIFKFYFRLENFRTAALFHSVTRESQMWHFDLFKSEIWCFQRGNANLILRVTFTFGANSPEKLVGLFGNRLGCRVTASATSLFALLSESTTWLGLGVNCFLLFNNDSKKCNRKILFFIQGGVECCRKDNIYGISL